MSLVGWVLVVFLGSNVLGLAYTYMLLGHPEGRIQKHVLTRAQFHARLPLVAFNLAVLLALATGSLSLQVHLFRMEWPGLAEVLGTIAFITVVDDTYFYFFHRALHENRFLFRHIHTIHHRAYAPVPMDYIYVHPLEWMLGALGIVLGVVVIVLVAGSISAWGFFGLVAYRNLRELQIHSGLPSRILCRIPGMGTTDHHDLHHAKLRGNYGATFKWWDRIFSTELVVHPNGKVTRINRSDEIHAP